MNITKIALFAAISCCSVSAMAQWQWIDGQGRKVFSDRAPPAEIPAKNVLRSPGGASLSKAAVAVPEAVPAPAVFAKPVADKGIDKGLEEQKRKQEEQEAAKTQAEKVKKEKARFENCNRAKQAKATLTSGRMLSNVNANGERGFMDEASREAEVKRADSVIASECGPAPEGDQ